MSFAVLAPRQSAVGEVLEAVRREKSTQKVSQRKEVAELRGSLQPFAKGAVVTTSHFSKAAIDEASQEGKNPIALVDGFRLSKVVLDEEFQLAV